jgi:hypothetical protein
MSAQERINVFREGQLSAKFPAAICPYLAGDWRAGTWAKGRKAAQDHHAAQLAELDTVPCGICDAPTRMLGTKRCDRCWELECRIRCSPDIARQILDSL